MRTMTIQEMRTANAGLLSKVGYSVISCGDCGRTISSKWCWTSIQWYNHKASANDVAKKHCKGRSCKWWNWNTNW